MVYFECTVVSIRFYLEHFLEELLGYFFLNHAYLVQMYLKTHFCCCSRGIYGTAEYKMRKARGVLYEDLRIIELSKLIQERR